MKTNGGRIDFDSLALLNDKCSTLWNVCCGRGLNNHVVHYAHHATAHPYHRSAYCPLGNGDSKSDNWKRLRELQSSISISYDTRLYLSAHSYAPYPRLDPRRPHWSVYAYTQHSEPSRGHPDQSILTMIRSLVRCHTQPRRIPSQCRPC
jgi:hypothetical protein